MLKRSDVTGISGWFFIRRGEKCSSDYEKIISGYLIYQKYLPILRSLAKDWIQFTLN